ncbi:MAG: hypothetical protein NKF70_13005 [Methanobacterium sp. ERen5]|nr:MAG: hypothetical protein NKF70_13005 [Methanobacterium sp. ERen5]
MKDDEGILNSLEEISQEISIFKGEELVNFTKRNRKSLKEYTLTFKVLNGRDISNTHDMIIKANNLKILKHDNVLSDVFYKVEPEKVIGKKLIEYENWQTEKLADTGNLSGPQPNLTLIFEEGYYMEIEKIIR